MPKISFFVSGYGAFSTFDLNPTDYLVNEINNNPDDFLVDEGRYDFKFLKVSEVSAIGALQTLLDMQTKYISIKERADKNVFLHLGVSGEATELTLEENAYNQAEWGIPDTKGWTPGYQQVSIEILDCEIS